MDSFLSLFDPDTCSECNVEDFGLDNLNNQSALPPEPQLGNVEYKLKITNPSKQRFEHLVTQMKWRLREGNGEAIYEIGVEDNGMLRGLTERDLSSSLQNLQQMALKLGATTTILRERELDNGKTVAEVLVRKVQDDQNNIDVRIAVLGNADGGKSTLLGVLTQGHLDNGRGKARLNMFRHLHEIQSGRTSSISHEILGFNTEGQPINYSYSELITAEEICEESAKLVTFLDLAGHKKYLRTTILGLSGYLPHHAMLVISSSAGAVGMAQEHLALVTALNVPFFIVVTKTDVMDPNNALGNLKELLSQFGSARVSLVIKCLDDVINASANQVDNHLVPIFCVSSVTGDGLDLLLKFLHLLPPGITKNEKEKLEKKPPEFQVDELFRAGNTGQVLGGLLIQGVITEGSAMQIGPLKNGSFQKVIVKSIHRNRVPCRVVHAGQSAAMCLDMVIPSLRHGMVLLDVNQLASGSLFFQARVSVLYHATAVQQGFQTTVHIGNVCQTAIIVGIFTSSKCIHTNEEASVLFKFKNHPEYVSVGQRLLLREGSSKGIGEITQVFPIDHNLG